MPVIVIQKGKRKKIPAIDAIFIQLMNDAIKGESKARKLALEIYAKHNGKTQSSSLTNLAEGRSPFQLSAEDEANIAKHNLLKGVK